MSRLPSVTVLLSFYDEPATRLFDVCTAASTTGVDRIVAVDGAYGTLEGGKPESPPNNAEAIFTACKTTGMKLQLHVPEDVWSGDEIEKRTRMFRIAEEHTSERDWFFVLDADTLVTQPIDLPSALVGLSAYDVATVTVRDRGEKRYRFRSLFRALRGLEVVDDHYTYRTADGRYLWSGPTKKMEDAADLGVLEVWHLGPVPGGRREKQDAYYEERKRLRLEGQKCECGEQATRLVVLFENDGEIRVLCRKCAHKVDEPKEVYS